MAKSWIELRLIASAMDNDAAYRGEFICRETRKHTKHTKFTGTLGFKSQVFLQ
jgi:hypothetical protein